MQLGANLPTPQHQDGLLLARTAAAAALGSAVGGAYAVGGAAARSSIGYQYIYWNLTIDLILPKGPVQC